MLDYVVQVRKDATRIGPSDHQRLRAVGFDDTAMLQIALIASWFNYINGSPTHWASVGIDGPVLEPTGADRAPA